MNETYTVAGLPITQADDAVKKICGLVWGPSGCGKTTLCSTLPGKKLWINFDPQGLASVATRKDIVTADFSQEEPSILDKIRTDSFGGLTKYLDDIPEIESIVLDSTTMLTQLALYRAVEMGGVRGMTIETPGKPGYGRRNIIMLDVVRRLMILALKRDKHFFATAHEDDPVTDDNGAVLYITLMLGGKIANNMGLRLSEVWWMNDNGGKRRICVRPARSRRPMKTRMFRAGSEPEFDWTYNPEKPDDQQSNMTIAGWYNQWKNSGGIKLELPK
jgi:hypothetical protein